MLYPLLYALFRTNGINDLTIYGEMCFPYLMDTFKSDRFSSGHPRFLKTFHKAFLFKV